MKRNALSALGVIIFLLALLPAAASANPPRIGQDNVVTVQGGDTSASSGDATGGDANGGAASSNGGSASNNALVGGSNSSSGSGSDVDQQNNPDITQGNN